MIGDWNRCPGLTGFVTPPTPPRPPAPGLYRFTWHGGFADVPIELTVHRGAALGGAIYCASRAIARKYGVPFTLADPFEKKVT